MLFVFDLDGTLAALGAGVAAEDGALLAELVRHGHQIALCSGKPTYYLCGFVRQLGLPDTILIGENGASIQFGIDLPPPRRALLPIAETAKRNIATLRDKITAAFGDTLWCQPNEVSFTPFPQSPADFERIEALLAEDPALLDGVTYYRHCDSFDIVPAEVNKGAGLSYLSTLTGIPTADMVAIGNGVNDYPMFGVAGHSVGIALPDRDAADICFDTIHEALCYLCTL